MGTNDPQYGNLTPAPEPEQEKKKGNKKKALLLGLVALLGLGGACYVGTTLIDRPQPPREEEVVTMVAPTTIAPTETSYVVPLSPTPTEAEPIDVREGWYGIYDGTANFETYKLTTDSENPETILEDTQENRKILFYILRREDCGDVAAEICPFSEEQSWGFKGGLLGCLTEDVAWLNFELYLPADLSDAPGLTITEDKLTSIPTKEDPYEIIIEKVPGESGGTALKGTIISSKYVHEEYDTISHWTIDEFIVDTYTPGALGCDGR